MFEPEESWRSGGAAAVALGDSALGLLMEMMEEDVVNESKKSEAGLTVPLSEKKLAEAGTGLTY